MEEYALACSGDADGREPHAKRDQAHAPERADKPARQNNINHNVSHTKQPPIVDNTPLEAPQTKRSVRSFEHPNRNAPKWRDGTPSFTSMMDSPPYQQHEINDGMGRWMPTSPNKERPSGNGSGGGWPPTSPPPSFAHYVYPNGTHGGPMQIIIPPPPAPDGTNKKPTMQILDSCGEQALDLWRAQLPFFNAEVERYRKNVNPYYKVQLSNWVLPDVWWEISQDHLNPEDQTTGAALNDPAVEDFLRQEGAYAVDEGKRGTVHYASPPKEFRKLKWIYIPGRGCLKPFEIFMRSWRRLMSTMPEGDLPEPDQLAIIMADKIVPLELKNTVDDRCLSGRGPNRLIRTAAAWRRKAKKHWKQLKKVIRENAEQMDMDAELPTDGPAQEAGRTPTTGATPLPGRASTPGEQPPLATRERSPICAADGCYARVRKRRDGTGWFTYCYDHAHLWKPGTRYTRVISNNTGAEKKDTSSPTAATVKPWNQCRLEGCTNERYMDPTKGWRSPACSLPHLKEWRKTPAGQLSRKMAHKVCWYCEGQHSVLACPELTETKRREMERQIGYRHTEAWWINEGNRAKVEEFKTTSCNADDQPKQQTPSPAMMSAGCMQPKNPYAHGVATVLGMRVDAYFDLGGIRILLNDDGYEGIVKAIQNGFLPGTEMVTLEEMGYGRKGVPVDLACSTNEGSSVVWIKRWVRTTIEINTVAGRVHVLTRQVIGFVRRSTPLLIVGQDGCRLCGYKTIEEQDLEYRKGHSKRQSEYPTLQMMSKPEEGNEPTMTLTTKPKRRVASEGPTKLNDSATREHQCKEKASLSDESTRKCLYRRGQAASLHIQAMIRASDIGAAECQNGRRANEEGFRKSELCQTAMCMSENAHTNIWKFRDT